MLRARAIFISVGGLALLASLVLAGAARAQNKGPTPIGKIITASGVINVEHADAVVLQASLPANAGQAKVGDLVYQGDVVSTGPDGAMGITFTDGTAFNLSNNARMVLNEFVYDPNGKSNSTFFTFSKGTFTFIAGKVARTGDMKIDTPVATMGIRGTTPHVEVSSDGKVTFNTLIEDKKAIEKILGGAPEPPKKQLRRTAANAAPAPPAIAPAIQVERKPDVKIDGSYLINIKICNC